MLPPPLLHFWIPKITTAFRKGVYSYILLVGELAFALPCVFQMTTLWAFMQKMLPGGKSCHPPGLTFTHRTGSLELVCTGPGVQWEHIPSSFLSSVASGVAWWEHWPHANQPGLLPWKPVIPYFPAQRCSFLSFSPSLLLILLIYWRLQFLDCSFLCILTVLSDVSAELWARARITQYPARGEIVQHKERLFHILHNLLASCYSGR